VTTILTQGATGITAIVETDTVFNIWSPLAVIRCGNKAEPYYILNFLRSKNFQEAVTLNWSFGTQQNIGMGVIENLTVLLPPNVEQQSIAIFLNHETAKIDNLIAEQQQLIKLLKEKRQAVISHAVTKGLNPDVPMKDSGVEWLGEVPEHWDVKRLKYKFRLLTEKSVQSENTIALENIESWTGRFIYTESLFEGSGVNFDNGDILFGKLRPYLAKVFHCENEGEAIGDFFVLRPSKDTNSQFAQYQILNSDFIAIVDSSTYGTKMPRVNWEFFSNMVISSPPIDEQQQINHFLKVDISKFENLDQEAKSIINLLKERRSALISSAVTGKIDVRNFVPSQPNVEAVV
jgi:type I restriction enzyme S subunit